MLARIGRIAKRVEITLLMDAKSPVLVDAGKIPDEVSLFHRTEWTYKRLRAAMKDEGVKIEEPILLNKAVHTRSPTLFGPGAIFFLKTRWQRLPMLQLK